MWRKESSEPRRGKYLEPLGFGETQSHWRRVIPGPPGPGESQSQPVIRATGTQARLLAPEGGRAAQRTLRNRRDGTARLGEAAASHTCSGLVLLCPTGQNPPHRHAAAAIPADVAGPAVPARRRVPCGPGMKVSESVTAHPNAPARALAPTGFRLNVSLRGATRRGTRVPAGTCRSAFGGHYAVMG
jgi:hypothetical protein